MALGRRKVVAGFGVAAAAAAAGGALFLHRRDEGRIERVRQIVGPDNGTSRTICWEGPQGATLELRSPDGSVKRFASRSVAHKSGKELFRINTVRLEGLSPASSHAYRIEGGNREWTEFRTASPETLEALVFPDSQSTDHYATWKQLYEGALRRHPKADFTANLGDLVDCGAWTGHWKDWFGAVSEGISRLPIAPVMGNHDTYDENARIGMPENYLAAFPVPGNGSSGWDRWYYAFDSGPVRFIVLSTEWLESDHFRPGLLPEMKAWFKDAARTNKPWKVVMMHRNTVTNNIRGRRPFDSPFSEIGRELMPLFDAARVDAVLSGHLHTYRNRGHIRAFMRDESGPLYIMSGVAGNIRYNNFWIDSAFDRFIAPQPETDNYIVLSAKRDSLSVRSHLPDGSLMDETVLRKT
ncbi:MAG: metallophosphoesterase [Sutterellaceae bacterium]|nr:metallophosphoesterase [Sutterellaceae bacterium]MDD7442360.1 metallophosphoesterase [Sutterellaceae bacterium]MDY2867994.1 metallophosphoesterase [Mesosutterella sp.]